MAANFEVVLWYGFVTVVHP